MPEAVGWEAAHELEVRAFFGRGWLSVLIHSLLDDKHLAGC